MIIAGVGEFTLRADGSYTLTPVADWNGRVPTITYTVNDALIGGNTTGTLNIIMSPVVDINADNATTHAGNSVTTDVLANDNFSNPDATITAVTNGTNGTATLQNGQIIYTPRSGFVGTDTYTYTVTSGGVTETSTVTVFVTNDVPVVNPEGVITPQGDAYLWQRVNQRSRPERRPNPSFWFPGWRQQLQRGRNSRVGGCW